VNRLYVESWSRWKRQRKISCGGWGRWRQLGYCIDRLKASRLASCSKVSRRWKNVKGLLCAYCHCFFAAWPTTTWTTVVELDYSWHLVVNARQCFCDVCSEMAVVLKLVKFWKLSWNSILVLKCVSHVLKKRLNTSVHDVLLQLWVILSPDTFRRSTVYSVSLFGSSTKYLLHWSSEMCTVCMWNQHKQALVDEEERKKEGASQRSKERCADD